jgi:hypothetical protein
VSQITNLGISGGQYGQSPGFFQYTSNIAAVLAYQTSGSPGPNRITGGSTYAYAGNDADGTLAIINSGGTGEREIGFPQLLLLENPSLPPATRYWQDTTFVPSLRIRGVASRSAGPWDNRSGQIANGTGNGWYIGVDLYYPPETVDGTPSSAFGFSAPGGTQANPSPSTFVGSVAVTPGQTYTIVVGGLSNGTLLPQFFGGVGFQFVQG